MHGIDELLDATACGLARERPIRVGPVYRLRTQCTRHVKECQLAEVLAGQRTSLERVADALHDASDPALAKILELCHRALADPDAARGRNCTWYLGDLIIALELPSEVPLFTTNVRHFEALCGALGKRVYQP